MERKKEENIGNVIARFLRQSQLETPLNEHRLIDSWEEVVGPDIAKMTDNLAIYNQTLYVTLHSPALRTQLLMQRASLVQRLNAKVGANVIVDIAFR